MTEDFVTVAWTPSGTIRLIDQTRLPGEEVYLECRTIEEVADAIRTMRVRGAPPFSGSRKLSAIWRDRYSFFPCRWRAMRINMPYIIQVQFAHVKY